MAVKWFETLISQGFQVSVSILVTQHGCGGGLEPPTSGLERTKGFCPFRVLLQVAYMLCLNGLFCVF